jgi:nitrate/nitrite transport system permease protein
MAHDTLALKQETGTPAAATADKANMLAVKVVQSGQNLLWTLASFSLLIAAWQIFCLTIGKDLPSPATAAVTLAALLKTPFSTDPNNVGIGIQLGASLKRVIIGFGLGAACAIPLGVLMGAVPTCKKLFDPIVQILRPVSPLVWFPLSLVAFKAMGGTATATLFTIFITSLWPTLINTAFGVSSLPQDYRTVARVFQFSPRRYFSRILLPFAMPHILTGLRLSMGVAWLVIVAAEMLSGDLGIGFFAWDSYNAGSHDKMVAAVICIGFIGLLIDRTFEALQKHFDYA